VPSRADDRRDRRLGDRVTTTPSTRIGTVLNSALSWLDPRGQAARARRARTHEVGVTQRTLADGLGQITVIDKLEVTRAMIERIDDDADEVLAHSAACGPCADVVPAEIGPARAAACAESSSRDHTIKTDGDLQILEHRADGTTRWRTRDGQVDKGRPRPYLPEAGLPPVPPDDEPCPF
jgi:hypothetical protein